MKVLGNRVFVRITKENRENIFSKEITRNDGSKVKLFLTVDAKEDEDRKSALFVQTGIIEGVGDGAYNDEDGSFIDVGDIRIGDTAILDYQVCNLDRQLVSSDDNGDVYWISATTTYHTYDNIVYANRRNPKMPQRDQIAFKKGDYNELSMLLGIVRNDKLIARSPYVFLEHQTNIIGITTKQGIYYEEKHRVLNRRILAVSNESTSKFGMKEGETVLIDDADIFTVKFGNRTVDCIHDNDVLAKSSLLESIKKSSII